CLTSGGVSGLRRSGCLVIREGGLVHQDVRAARGIHRGRGGARISGYGDLPAGSWHADDAGGIHDRAVWQRDGMAAMQPAPERSLGHPELTRELRVEAAEPVVFHERVTQRGGTSVIRREGAELVVSAPDDGAGL